MRIYLIPFIAIVISSCSSKNDSRSSSSNYKNEISEPSQEVEEQEVPGKEDFTKHKGLVLIEKSDCTTCHASNIKLVGPSYKEIALRYEASFDGQRARLVAAVLKGSNGEWGEVPMTAHPQHTEDEINSMLNYIMTFN